MPLNFVAKVAIEVALVGAQMALTATQRFEGQRLDDLKVTTADPGTPVAIFWGVHRFDGCPILWAEDIKEQKHTSKTKGGKYTNYKYFGTWMALIAGVQIDAVAGIWLDKNLCYQTTAAGPLAPVLGEETIQNGNTASAPVNLSLANNLAFYLGTETQLPDPRYEAWCEDKYGPDSAPAYRGRAIAVFKDIPLEKFGNRIPQISIEAVRNAAPAYPWEFTAAPTTFIGKRFSPDGTRLYSIAAQFMVWDVANRALLTNDTLPLGIGANTPYAFAPDAIYALDVVGQHLYRIGFDGGQVDLGSTGGGGWTNGVWAAGGMLLLAPGSFAGMNQAIAAVPAVPVAVNYFASSYFTTIDGAAIGVGTTSGNVLAIGPALANATLINTGAYSTSGAAYGFDNGTHFVIRQGSHLFLTTRTAPYSIVSAVNTGGSMAGDPVCTYTAIAPGAAWWWDGLQRRSSADLSVLQTATLSDWAGSGRAAEVAGTIWSSVDDALLSFDTIVDPGIIWRYLGRITNGGVTLQTISDEVGARCGMAAFDTSAGAAITIDGWCVTQGSGRDMLEPLFTLHDCDLAPHDFGQRIVRRSGVSTGSAIETEWLVADGEGSSSRYGISIAQEADVPQRLTVNYSDGGRDFQASNVVSMRSGETTDSKRERSIDMTTYVGPPPVMQQLADRYLRRQWNERESVKSAVTEKELTLEPADVRTQQLDELTRVGRCAKMTYSGGVLKCEWLRDAVSLATLSTGEGAEMTGRPPDTVPVLSPTKGLVLDIPLVSDAHDSSLPQFYYGAGKYLASTAWPGGSIYKGDAAGVDYSPWHDVPSSGGMIWGSATTALGDVASPWLWDRANSVNLVVRGGVLASSTEAAINQNPSINQCALRNPATGKVEIFNFATATLETDGSYTLRNLKRGRRGTEWATGAHAMGDEFVLTSALLRDGVGLSEVGTAEYFKATALGQDPDSVAAISFVNSGATLKPYAPSHVTASFNGSDWTFTIHRRTRLGGTWAGGGTIPLSEASEAYEIDVLSSGSAVRTLSLSGTSSILYTAAQQIADFGTVQTTKPALKAYQLSAAVGRGFALAA